MNKIELQQALSDVEILKQVLSGSNKDNRLVGITLKGNIVLMGISVFCAVALCVLELATNGSMTDTLMSAVNAPGLRAFGIGYMAFVLVGLVTLLYFILWRAAKHNGEEYSDYISRNFAYFKTTSLLSDLSMKFMTIALLVLASKPEWVPLVLTAFIGDYLFQCRFFTLPVKLSVSLGLVCFACSIGMFVYVSANLLIPLTIFALISSASLARLLMKQQKLTTPAESV